jgi:hypothetical protein
MKNQTTSLLALIVVCLSVCSCCVGCWARAPWLEFAQGARVEPIESDTFKLSITHVVKRAAFIRLSSVCQVSLVPGRERELLVYYTI